MAEVDEFLGSVLPTLHEMEMAFHNGDVGPRMATWSHNNPVTLFGALLTKSGWSEVAPAFEILGVQVLQRQGVQVRGHRGGGEWRPRLHRGIRTHDGFRWRAGPRPTDAGRPCHVIWREPAQPNSRIRPQALSPANVGGGRLVWARVTGGPRVDAHNGWSMVPTRAPVAS